MVQNLCSNDTADNRCQGKLFAEANPFYKNFLSIVKEFRLVARSLIEVMKKGRMEEGGGCGGCCTVKKKVTDFSVPSRLPAGKNLIRRLGRGKLLTLFYSVITSSGPFLG
jgi:hypothetical protein